MTTIEARKTKQPEPIWFMGTLVNILLGKADGREDISVIEHRLPYGEAPPLHVHRNEDEVFHILKGFIRFRIGDRRIVAGPGETLVAPKGIPHGFRVESPEGAHCITITTGRDFETLVRTFGAPARSDTLPPAMEPSPEMIEALTRTCQANGIDIVGAPLS